MANSVFVGPFGIAFNGSGFVFPSPGLFPDGTLAAPGISFANEPGSGLRRAAAGDVRMTILGADFVQFTGSTMSVLAASGIAVPSGASFGVNANFFLTGTGAGLFTVQNNAASAGFGVDTTTDAVFKLRTRAQTGYATLDCLGLKASGVAGANFGPSVLTSITIVNGIVTAAS